MKVVDGVSKMHGNDAVLLLADGAAMLPLNAGRFDSFFDETRFVDNANWQWLCTRRE